MTSHLHIKKFEILTFSNTIHKNSDLFVSTCDMTHFSELKKLWFFFMDFIEEARNVVLVYHFCSILRKSHLYGPLGFEDQKFSWIQKLQSLLLFKLSNYKNFGFWKRLDSKSKLNIQTLCELLTISASDKKSGGAD